MKDILETEHPAVGALEAHDAAPLAQTLVELSATRDLAGVMAVVRRAARDLTGADGVTFVLREGDQVYYADENAIGPLWKGRRFPASCCISGWAIQHRRSVVIEDIYLDARIPHDAYRPTFVRSLAMVPIRPEDPIGAIGAYWGTARRATGRELRLLQTIANAAAVTLSNVDLYQRLAQAVRVRDEFLDLAAHELRTPLTALKLHVGLLARCADGTGDAAELRRGIARSEQQVRRVERLMEDLLRVSRVSPGQLRLEVAEVDLAALAADVVAAQAEEITRSRSRVEVHAPAPVVGRWDRARLEQVLASLLSNALKFGGGRPVEVTVDGDAERGRISVRDEGVGIHPADQARIFERFERAVSTESYGGLGLGLWAARQVVGAHGGVIEVESAPERGATFRVALPRTPPAFVARA